MPRVGFAGIWLSFSGILLARVQARKTAHMRLWFKKEHPTKETSSKPAPAKTDEPSRRKVGEDSPLPVLDVASSAAGALLPADEQRDGSSLAAAATEETAYKSDHRSLYKQLLSGLYDAVLVTDPKGHVIDSNARVSEFFTYTPEEIWDMPISELVPGVNTALIARIQQGLAGEKFVLLDGRCLRKDRSTFAAEIAISPINLMNDGDFVFCIRNIDRRHVQMQRLKSCQSLLNHVVSASAACDPDANIKVANAALIRLLGLTNPSDLEGKPFSLLWKDARSPEVIGRVLAGESVRETVQVANAAGTRLQVTLSLAPEFDARRKIIGFLAAFAPAAVVSLGSAASKKGVDNADN